MSTSFLSESTAESAAPEGTEPTLVDGPVVIPGSGPGRSTGDRPRRSWAQRAILGVNAALIGVSLLSAFALNYGFQRTSSINRVALARNLTALPAGVEPGERVLNILLVGSDSSAGLDADDPVQAGREGERFGDVIIVAHIDERTRSVALLSFPRDLWVPIAGTTTSDRINRAFVVGGPGTLIDTIESGFDLPIHHYINVDFAGFQGLIEAVGSVTVPFPEPARDWNVAAKPKPRTQTGFFVGEAGCHALDGPTSLAYVRSRFYQTQNSDGEWITDPTSDFGRIRRQQDFLKRLAQAAIDRGARNPFVLNELLDAALANVAIDQELTPALILDLGLGFRSFEPGELEAFSIPAVDAEVNGNQVLEAVPDRAGPVLNLFRGAAVDDPATVEVTLVTDNDPDEVTVELVRELEADLAAQGFATRRLQRKIVPDRIRVVHGRGGAASAAMVAPVVRQSGGQADRVDELSEVVVVPAGGDRLHSRSVEIEIGPQEASTAPEQISPSSDPDGDGTDGAAGESPLPQATNLGENPQAAPSKGAALIPSPGTTDSLVHGGGELQSNKTDEWALSC